MAPGGFVGIFSVVLPWWSMPPQRDIEKERPTSGDYSNAALLRDGVGLRTPSAGLAGTSEQSCGLSGFLNTAKT
jgi:hypothetical protein